MAQHPWRAVALALTLVGVQGSGLLPGGSWPVALGRAEAKVKVAPTWVYRRARDIPSPRARWKARLFAQLEQGDRRRLPRLQRLPGGGTRYLYRRQIGEPPLTVPQLRALLRNPPRYDRERRVISRLLDQLTTLGVKVELRQGRSRLAAGEWIPARATVRIRPDIPSAGSRVFARVLNHEAIHVAQSCRGGGLRRRPVALSLSRRLNPEIAALLRRPPYTRISARVRQLEEEAFAHQGNLGVGLSLLKRHCQHTAS